MDDRSGSGAPDWPPDMLLAAEGHHRFANSLQLLLTLVAQRRRHAPTAEAKQQLRWMEGLVQALVMLQEPLGASGPAGGVGRYLAELPELWRPICTARSIRMTVDSDPVSIEPEKQLPLALAAHELTTNAIRHAFGDRGGRIRIALKHVSRTAAELSVADDGVGLHDDGAPRGAGLAMIETLVKQIGGTLRLENQQGTTGRIRFPVS